MRSKNPWRLVRPIAFVGLLMLGAIEVFYGAVFGSVQIKMHEGNFAVAMNSNEWTTQQNSVFWKYISIFKDQWGVVALFGVLTIVLALIWFLEEKNSDTKKSDM